MNLSRSRWRLMHSQPAPGAWNMAVDEAILEAVGRGNSLPTLRLYAWEPPCLSLGYAQPAADVNMERLSKLGWQFVRRPTGGRAILHTDELTYAVIAPLHEPRVAGSVLDSYSRLSQALLNALQLLSLPALAKKTYGASRRNTNPICFEVPSNYEITVDGKKLIGSAQARRKEGVLQHGSLPLYGNLARIIDVMNYDESTNNRSEAARQLLNRATTVEQVLNHPIDWDQAAEAFKAAFEQSLNLEFEPGELSPDEYTRAEELSRIKYGSDEWNKRV